MRHSSFLSTIVFLVLLSVFLLSGCGPAIQLLAAPTDTPVPPTSTPEPTATATTAPTATATATLAPTETPTTVPSPTEDREARSAMKKTATAGELNAMVVKDLEKYGVDPEDGHVVWAGDKAVKLDLTTYMENKDNILEEVGKVTDFVIQSDITWETSGALSLCGITFHAGEDLAVDAQNRFFMMRLQFDPGWTIWRWEYGQFQSFVTGGWFPSRDIHDENGDENTVGLVVRGKDIDIYINHDHQRKAEDVQLKDGMLALSAWQESGKTKCIFENSWVWVFDR